MLVVKDAIGSVRIRSPYYIGDWLINYQGGFIRRGLPGQLIFWANRATHVPSPWIVFVVSMFLYLLFQLCIFRMTRGLQWTYILVALMLSPATLAFEFLNPAVGVRKEILLFLTLAWVMSSARIRHMNTRTLSVLLTAACVAMVLSHESLLVYLPYVFAGLVIRFHDVKKAVRTALLPGLATGIAVAAVLLHPGSVAVADRVCTSIGGQLEPFGVFDGSPCSGAVAWLQENLADAHTLTWQYVGQYNFYRVFSVLAVLAFSPVAVLLYRVYVRSTERLAFWAVITCALTSALGSVILFYGALDWGRWIHFHVICLMLLLLGLFKEHEEQKKAMAIPTTRRVFAMSMIFLYATTWTLPVTRTANRSVVGGVWQRLGEKMSGRPDSSDATLLPENRAAKDLTP